MFRKRAHQLHGESVTEPLGGQDRCDAAGCGHQTGVRCNYVDKRNRPCATSWCAEHWVIAQGKPYCRRHATTIEAIGGAEQVGGLPDVDNRAPALCGWLSRELDEPIREILVRVAPDEGATLVTDPVRLVISPGVGGRRWQRTWKLVDHASVLNRVSIEVDEKEDTVVAARVDTDLIGQGVPPWIEARLEGRAVDRETDAAERRRFRDAMVQSIDLVVTRQEAVTRY